MTSPFLMVVNDESIATYVPQTGSCLSIVGGEDDFCAGPAEPVRCVIPVQARNTKRAIERITEIAIANSIRVRRKRNMRREAVDASRLPAYFFFFGALGFVNVVFTVPPSCAIRSFAEGAKLPSGFNSRYFCSASTVPGSALIFPVASVVALDAR
jgi:hypothetical protein